MTEPRLPIVMTAVLLVVGCQLGGKGLSSPVWAGQVPVAAAQALPGQLTDPHQPGGEPTLKRGMGKEAVRTAWGEPKEVRKIRTCFGWQEEWVYRGDPQRFGASERTLLFDEGEVLSEIK
jgi:hypothetical protein